MDTAILEVATATNVTMSGLLLALLLHTMKTNKQTDKAITEVAHSVQLLNVSMQNQNALMEKELEHINSRIDNVQ